eukprot:scaffold363_cov331-Pavlova_lutheri.AAC.66
MDRSPPLPPSPRSRPHQRHEGKGGGKGGRPTGWRDGVTVGHVQLDGSKRTAMGDQTGRISAMDGERERERSTCLSNVHVHASRFPTTQGRSEGNETCIHKEQRTWRPCIQRVRPKNQLGSRRGRIYSNGSGNSPENRGCGGAKR